MAINYNPKDLIACQPAGEYPASIAAMNETESKAGNPMIKVEFDVYLPNGNTVKLNDYIVFPSTAFKLKKLAQATNNLEAFNSGTFASAPYVGKNLALILDVKESDEYGDQNTVKAYKAIGPGGQAAPAPVSQKFAARSTKPATEITDTDIPF